MAEYFKIAEDDPDLDAFERLIANDHPWYRRFKKKAENRPSYKHKNFSYKAFEQGPFPGNDDPYCPFAFSFFNDAHVHNYLLDCHLFLETPYGRKRDKGMNKLEESFDQIAKNESSVLIQQLKLLSHKSSAIWIGLLRDYIVERRDYINDELKDLIVEECEEVSDELWELSKSEEFDVGELKTLDSHGRYGLLAKLLLQDYKRISRELMPGYIRLWWAEMTKKIRFEQKKAVKLKIPAGYKKKLPKYIDVVLAHHLVMKLDTRVELPDTPTDFIFKEINKNKYAKSRDLRAQYRWLFIKAWLYSYLNKFDLTLSEVAEQISNDNDFFYMSDMAQLGEPDNKLTDDEIANIRFLDLKNNLSAWANDKSEKGYIYSQILGTSIDQA
ncbi:hypothetical protein Q9X98_003798 [Vibrio parahaemolyticus]|nr:hypothetical protein [Vibrio parahaemolyticus]ELA7322183.1 hypothetical protein [Vibrio parahaemolyticus]